MVTINYKKGVINEGDTRRLQNTFVKALKGEKVTIGFLGGSITQGSLSSVQENCYASRVAKWFRDTFKDSEITFINAGIGGTPSDFGAARVTEDLLKYKPDFTIVEFSVNDSPTDYFMETYEGLVRHILSDSTENALMLVHNVRYDNMESAEDKHVIIGKYYDLPEVSMKYSLFPEVKNGNIDNREVTPDDLHPNDEGHRILSEQIIYYLEEVLKKVSREDALIEVSKTLPKPLTMNTYEHSRRLRNINSNPKLEGFEKDLTPQSHITEFFRYGFTAWKAGDSIEFEADCANVTVQYRKSIVKPAPMAKVTIDGEYEAILDGEFSEDWGDCLYTQPVLIHGGKKHHKIKITIIKDHSKEEIKDAVPFYLVSVIVSE